MLPGIGLRICSPPAGAAVAAGAAGASAGAGAAVQPAHHGEGKLPSAFYRKEALLGSDGGLGLLRRERIPAPDEPGQCGDAYRI